MYFDKPGPENTKPAIKLVLETAKEKGISHIVVASTSGKSVPVLLDEIADKNLKVIVVTHNVGFSEEGKNEFDPKIKKEIEDAGHTVLTSTMATRNINKAISSKFGGYSQIEIINSSLRMLGQGMKVCPEITAMAADSGLIPFDDVIAVAGTGKGWDTAVIIKANSSNHFFKQKIREIICKPNSF
jgi:uncharacterized protein